MSFAKLQAYEKARERERAEAEAERTETDARRALKRAVKAVIPKSVRMPRRPKGRTAIGGLTRKEVAGLRVLANSFLEGEAGLRKLEEHVKKTTIVILLIDGVLGTEPWRAAGGPHGGLIAANARLRYLENAIRILDDLRRSNGGAPADKLLEGVIEAEVVKE